MPESTTASPVEKLEQAAFEMQPCIAPELPHEVRVVESMYKEISRTHRTYGAYCVHCRKSTTVEIEIK